MAVYTTIDDPGSFFSNINYTGTGSSLAITGVGFQPDNVWIKSRSSTRNHADWDSVRGVEKIIALNLTDAEVSDSNGLTAFGADGFTVGSLALINASTETFASWNWKAGTTTGIAGSPSITPSSYSFNATSGFSIIAYTGNGSSGATLPHGLGVAPKMIIVKELGGADAWLVYHIATGNTKYLQFNAGDSASTGTGKWNDTSPTSTLFSLGSNTDVNASGVTYIAYCFAPVQGYSKFGSYEGNGNADGTFVYTGFQPEFIIQKDYDATRAWGIFYRKSEATLGNVIDKYLHTDTDSSEQESSSNALDFVSNGFKFRGSGAVINTTSTYLFMAFARRPFVNSSSIPGPAH